ncbi:MAG: hypothetical protein JWR32_2808 [Mycobacterium sp.]|jgi:hypothetical protein|nr:hypothetical protein [Mycobacterium sp.]
MPSTIRAVSRRRVLLGAATLAVVSAAASTCGSRPEPPKVDDLKSQLDLARRDSEMAKAAAAGADSYAPALTVVAGERAAHARALSQEIARAAGASPSPAPTPSPSPTATAAAPTPPPSLSDVTTALRTSADGAAQLAAKLSGYRAGLLGSIAASCAASVTVPLAIKEPTQ